MKMPPEFQARLTVGIHKTTRKEIPMARTLVVVLGFFLVIPVAAFGATARGGNRDDAPGVADDPLFDLERAREDRDRNPLRTVLFACQDRESTRSSKESAL